MVNCCLFTSKAVFIVILFYRANNVFARRKYKEQKTGNKAKTVAS